MWSFQRTKKEPVSSAKTFFEDLKKTGVIQRDAGKTPSTRARNDHKPVRWPEKKHDLTSANSTPFESDSDCDYEPPASEDSEVTDVTDFELEPDGDPDYRPPAPEDDEGSDFSASEADPINDPDYQVPASEDSEVSCEFQALRTEETINIHVSENSCSSVIIPITSDKQVTVTVAQCKTGNRRVWDKKHCCLYCSKLVSKMARHLEQVHAEEREVAECLSFEKKSKQRKQKWQELLKKGDFHHNKDVLNKGHGVIIPCKRPTNEVDTSNYIPCSHCLGMFLHKDLWRHARTCHPSMARAHCKADGRMLLPTPVGVSDAFKRNILSTMVSDQISSEVSSDPLILAFGERMFANCVGQQHQYNYVKQKLRELGRFLITIKQQEKTVQKLEDCIDPSLFGSVIKAVKIVSGFNDSGTYKVPSLALKLGHSLKKCAQLKKSKALQCHDETAKKKASHFVELYISDWASEISKLALQTLHMQTFNKPKRLPFAEDLKLLNKHLEVNAEKLETLLEAETPPSPDIWRELNEITLAQVVLFNRRRGGETERIELSQYKEGIASRGKMQEEIYAGLSGFEKKLAASLDRIEIRGKRGRRVPVLFTKNHKRRIDSLLKHRAAVGVSPCNKFLFPRGGDLTTSLRSSDVLRKYAAACGAKHPELITSTMLRKHVATISQILNLKKHELDSLANFLGHDIQVHRNFYRLPEDTVQLAKVSKILMELESGNISKYSGKSLNEINVEEEIEEVEQDTEEVDQDIEEVEYEDKSEDDENEMEGQSQRACQSLSNEKWDEKPNSLKRKSKIAMPQRQSTTKMPKRNCTTKMPWSPEESEAAERQLGKYLRLNQLPGKAQCEEAKRKEPALHSRPWSQIKYFIKNMKARQARQVTNVLKVHHRK